MVRVFVLASLAALAPFAIDTYLPAFHVMTNDLETNPHAIQQSLTFYLFPYALMTLFHGAISDAITYQKSVDILGFEHKTNLFTGLNNMWDWAKQQPKRERFVWSSYELDKGIYEFWRK